MPASIPSSLGTRRSQSRGFILLIGLLLLIVLMAIASREDYWGDEGFTVRRVQATWAQLYNPFAYQPPGDADPFDTSFVYDFNPPLYFALIRTLAGANPAPMTMRLFSIVPMAAATVRVIPMP